jgi:hypothetical protein
MTNSIKQIPRLCMFVIFLACNSFTYGQNKVEEAIENISTTTAPTEELIQKVEVTPDKKLVIFPYKVGIFIQNLFQNTLPSEPRIIDTSLRIFFPSASTEKKTIYIVKPNFEDILIGIDQYGLFKLPVLEIDNVKDAKIEIEKKEKGKMISVSGVYIPRINKLTSLPFQEYEQTIKQASNAVKNFPWYVKLGSFWKSSAPADGIMFCFKDRTSNISIGEQILSTNDQGCIFHRMSPEFSEAKLPLQFHGELAHSEIIFQQKK